MGLKKNNPGCGCCDKCINGDTNGYEGVAISGLPVFSITMNTGVATTTDPNATYLWSASTPGSECATTPPASWVLGTNTPTIGCCSRDWTMSTTGTVNTGITWTCGTGSPTFTTAGTVEVVMHYNSKFRMSISIFAGSWTVSVSYSIVTSLTCDVPADNNITNPPGFGVGVLAATFGGLSYGGNWAPITGVANGIARESGFWETTPSGDSSFFGSSANSGGLVQPITAS